MIKFKTYEELAKHHPLDNKSNLKFLVSKSFCFAITQTDLDVIKKEHPYGWEDKEAHKWYFWNINGELWYDTYIYNGENWILGVDTWDGIYYANEPKWGVHRANTIQKSEFGVFRTIEEAEEYRNKKVKELLEF